MPASAPAIAGYPGMAPCIVCPSQRDVPNRGDYYDARRGAHNPGSRKCGQTAPACGTGWRPNRRRMDNLRARSTGQHRPTGSK